MAEPPYSLRSRHRQSKREESRDDLSSISQEETKQGSFGRPSVLGLGHWLFIIGLVASFYALSMFLDSKLPSPLPDNQFDQFSEDRARVFLKRLTDLGPKPAGSEACEIETVKLIHEQLSDIKSVTNRLGVNRIEIDTQRPSGCFNLKFLTDFTLCYRNVSNIIARFGPKNGPTTHSVLINCHFDSTPDSPGVTDDGVSSEENGLLASHGFITAHPWRHSIRAFINLEGAGAGGRELLFQAGPGTSWLIKVYLENAPRPHCSVLGQEIFQSGVVPSDTDFRIFRDFGRVPGLDIAYVRNGYVYHTEFDALRFIPSGAIQRAGENVLGSLRGMLASPYLGHPGEYEEGGWVFYDVIGLFVLSYSQNLSEKINLFAVFLVILKIIYNFTKSSETTHKSESSYSIILLLAAIATQLFALSMVVIIGLFMTQVLGVLGLNMVWYSRPWLILFIYFLPQIMAALAVHCFFATKFYRKRDPFLIEQCYFDAMLAVYAVILLFLTYQNIASAFFLMLHVVFPLLRDALKFVIHQGFPQFVCSAPALMLCQFVCLSPVILIGCHSVMFVCQVFIPILGRSGQASNPEFLIMALSTLGACIFTLYTSNLIYLSERIWHLMKCGLAVVIVVLLLLLTTRLGEPFKFTQESPRLKRVWMLHVNRRIYSADDVLAANESGLWAFTMDFRGAEELPMQEGYMQDSKAPDCSDTHDFYCQLPYFRPIADRIPPARTRWLSLPTAPPLPQPIQLQMKSKQILGSNRVNLTFSLDGSDRIALHVTPINGWKLEQWSFAERTPLHSSQHSYFVDICSGKYSGPMDFWITLKSENSEKSEIKSKQLELVVTSLNLHGKYQLSEPLEKALKLTKSNREESQSWKWAITPVSGCAELISRYF